MKTACAGLCGTDGQSARPFKLRAASAIIAGDLNKCAFAIRKLLPKGHCSIQAIASLMACDKRTLQRTLKQEGTSYQQLLDEVRYTMAQEHLRDSSMPLTNLAILLGYTDASSFSRAFKQ